jgi:hypothetical protein
MINLMANGRLVRTVGPFNVSLVVLVILIEVGLQAMGNSRGNGINNPRLDAVNLAVEESTGDPLNTSMSEFSSNAG